jgi:hypothetical protein
MWSSSSESEISFFERDLVGEEMFWIDLASTCQLDPPPKAIRTKEDKKLMFKK